MNVKNGEIKLARSSQGTYKMLAFSGIHIIGPQIFNLMEQREGSFSIIDVYLEAIKKHKIVGFEHNEGVWLDVGKRENLEKAFGIIDQIPLE